MRRLICGLLFLAAFSTSGSTQAPQAAGVTVFEGARLITGDGTAPIENSAFIVANNRFTQIGRRGQVAVPVLRLNFHHTPDSSRPSAGG